eukprot:375702_1
MAHYVWQNTRPNLRPALTTYNMQPQYRRFTTKYGMQLHYAANPIYGLIQTPTQFITHWNCFADDILDGYFETRNQYMERVTKVYVGGKVHCGEAVTWNKMHCFSPFQGVLIKLLFASLSHITRDSNYWIYEYDGKILGDFVSQRFKINLINTKNSGAGIRIGTVLGNRLDPNSRFGGLLYKCCTNLLNLLDNKVENNNIDLSESTCLIIDSILNDTGVLHDIFSTALTYSKSELLPEYNIHLPAFVIRNDSNNLNGRSWTIRNVRLNQRLMCNFLDIWQFQRRKMHSNLVFGTTFDNYVSWYLGDFNNVIFNGMIDVWRLIPHGIQIAHSNDNIDPTHHYIAPAYHLPCLYMLLWRRFFPTVNDNKWKIVVGKNAKSCALLYEIINLCVQRFWGHFHPKKWHKDVQEFNEWHLTEPHMASANITYYFLNNIPIKMVVQKFPVNGYFYNDTNETSEQRLIRKVRQFVESNSNNYISMNLRSI